jgi:N-acyl-D-aspartate/D-glutamate deacylase
MLEGPAYVTFYNYFTGDLEPAREMLAHPYTHVKFSDGGTHVATVCDGSFPPPSSACGAATAAAARTGGSPKRVARLTPDR